MDKKTKIENDINHLKERQEKTQMEIQKLEGLLLKLVPFKKGKWYRDTESEFLILIKEDCDYDCDDAGVGFGKDGEWGYLGTCFWEKTELIEANDSYVKTKLINEARKRGFCYGKEFISPYSGNKTKIKSCYSFKKNALISSDEIDGHGDFVFYNGKWAELTEKEIPKIHGYEMKQEENGGVSFGCHSFFPEDITNVYEFMKEHLVESIIIDGFEVGVESFKEVVEYLKM